MLLLPQIRFVATLANLAELARDSHSAEVEAEDFVATAAFLVVRSAEDVKLLPLLRHAQRCAPTRARPKSILTDAGPEFEFGIVEHEV